MKYRVFNPETNEVWIEIDPSALELATLVEAGCIVSVYIEGVTEPTLTTTPTVTEPALAIPTQQEILATPSIPSQYEVLSTIPTGAKPSIWESMQRNWSENMADLPKNIEVTKNAVGKVLSDLGSSISIDLGLTGISGYIYVFIAGIICILVVLILLR